MTLAAIKYKAAIFLKYAPYFTHSYLYALAFK